MDCMVAFSFKMYILLMPIISRFFGIMVFMYWREHAPPHFHAKYGNDEIIMEITTGKITGAMSSRALSLVDAWRQQHITELLDDWNLALQRQDLKRIEPLE